LVTVSFWVNLFQNDASGSQVPFSIFGESTDNQFFVMYHKYYTEWRNTMKTSGDVRIATYNIPGSGNNDGSGYGLGWQHFVATFNISGGAYSNKLYRNGVLVGNSAGASGQSDWVGDVIRVHIGANGSADGGSAFTDGQIDQVAIWSLELTNSAISEIYNNGVMRDLTTVQGANYTSAIIDKLIGYYQFEGNALDSSGNGFHGTLNGNAGFSTSQP